jgi:hypothetical protein
MLRLAHRIVTASPRNTVPWIEEHHNPASVVELAKLAQSEIANAHVVIADNVAEFVMEVSEKDELGLEDFACARLPLPSMFFEWRQSGLVNYHGTLVRQNACPLAGCFITEASVSELRKLRWFALVLSRVPAERRVEIVKILERSSFVLEGYPTLLMDYQSQPMLPGVICHIFLNADGQPIEWMQTPFNPLFDVDALEMFWAAWHIPLMTLDLMHCNNVTRRDITETEGPSPKWIRRQKAPTIRYHVLDINPMKEVLRTEGQIESNGFAKAMHICRGHRATYTAEKPMFGNPKLVGTFWVPAHVKGSAKNGTVIKDYRVKAPVGVTA